MCDKYNPTKLIQYFNISIFLPTILVFLPANCMCFCLQKQAILHASRGQICFSFRCKNSVKYPWCSGKFTCACRHFACSLREVLAASTQVNLPVFTGKLHVTQVRCVWGLFTCELQVKLPAFAGNFARASFTVFLWYQFIEISKLIIFTK